MHRAMLVCGILLLPKLPDVGSATREKAVWGNPPHGLFIAFES
jgi:hypothetical protein